MIKWLPRTHPMRCTINGHIWIREQLRRGRSRVEVCTRCGVVENYYDVIKELTA